MERFKEAMRPDDLRDLIRIVAGLLVLVGMLLAALRRSNPDVFGEESGAFFVFLLLALPTAFLYGLGVAPGLIGVGARRWQVAFAVAGTLLIPLTLYQLVSVVDDTYDESLVGIFVFALAAAAAVGAWLITTGRFLILIAATFGAITVLFFLDKLLGSGVDSDPGAVRLILLAYGVGVIVVGVLLQRADDPDSETLFSEFLTGAGIAALIAFLVGLADSIGALLLGFGGFFGADAGDLGQSWFWDLVMLAVGIGLIVAGVGRGLRGPAYVGAIILILYLYSVGLDLDGNPPEGKILGWPLILTLLGLGLFAFTLTASGPSATRAGSSDLGGWFDGEGEAERSELAPWERDRDAPAASRAPSRVEPTSRREDDPPTETQPGAPAETPPDSAGSVDEADDGSGPPLPPPIR